MLVYNRISPGCSAREKHNPVLLLDLSESVNFMCTVGLIPFIPAKGINVQVAIARTLYAGCVSLSFILGALWTGTEG